jgi:hypothetical protein
MLHAPTLHQASVLALARRVSLETAKFAHLSTLANLPPPVAAANKLNALSCGLVCPTALATLASRVTENSVLRLTFVPLTMVTAPILPTAQKLPQAASACATLVMNSMAMFALLLTNV